MVQDQAWKDSSALSLYSDGEIPTSASGKYSGEGDL